MNTGRNLLVLASWQFFNLIHVGCYRPLIMEEKDILNNNKDLHWFNNEDLKEPRALVLVIHGLNLKPEKMDDWASMLSKNGCLVMRVGLSGHNGIKESTNIKEEDWRNDFKEKAQIATKKAQELNIPLYFLGFSLGALVGLEWMSNNSVNGPKFEKMVLLAPAISIPWYAKIVRIFGFLGKRFLLPSRSPESYRANNGVSLASYNALFSLKDSLEKSRYQGINVDTLVIIDKYDELVSSKALVRIINDYRLSRWNLRFIDNKWASKNFGFRHLCVDQESMGPELWQRISNQVLKHFGLSYLSSF